MDQLRRAFDIAAAVVVVAGVMMLVRPGSRGPQLVADIGGAFTNATTGAIGSTVVPEQPDTSPGSTNPAGGALGSGVGSATVGNDYSPSDYNVPGGLHQPAYL